MDVKKLVATMDAILNRIDRCDDPYETTALAESYLCLCQAHGLLTIATLDGE